MQSLIPPNLNMPSVEDYISFAMAFPRDFISDLIRSYPVFKDHRHTLEEDLKLAHSIFVTRRIERASFSGVADAKAANRLYKALNAAMIELRAPEMWPRLRAANPVAFPAEDGVTCDPNKHFLQMIVAVDDLLAIAKAARDIDGRAIHQNRDSRWDLKGAAIALHHYWELCSGDSTVWNGYERQSESHKFIMDCLMQLDEDAKESSIRDFLTATP